MLGRIMMTYAKKERAEKSGRNEVRGYPAQSVEAASKEVQTSRHEDPMGNQGDDWAGDTAKEILHWELLYGWD